MAKKYSDLKDACWKGYKAVGMKDKNGRKVPNCIPEDNNKLITPIKQKSDDHKSYYNFLAAKAKLGKPFSNKEKDFVKSYKLMTQEELEHIDEIRGLDPVSQRALAKQRLTNLIKSGRGRGALVANQMRTLRAEELEISEESLEQLYEVLSKDAEASDWIKDFVHSTNPKFEGKSKEERIKMALGAYYAQARRKQQTEEVEQIDELSKSTLGSYVNKAAKNSKINYKIATDLEHKAEKSRKQSSKDSFNDIATRFKKKSWKRDDGVAKAVDRLTKEEIEMKKETKEDKKDSIPFDGPYKKFTGTTTDKSGAKHTAMSKVRHLARMAMKKQMSVKVLNKEGVLGTIAGGTLGALAGGPLGALAGAYLGHKAQQAGTNAKEVNKKLKKEEVSNTGPVKVKVQIAGNEPHEEKWETAKKKPVKEEYDEEGNITYSKLSFTEFMEGMTATVVRPGVTRYTGGSYGNAKGAKYGNTDYDKETLDSKEDESKEEPQKRGRGRPAGAKSGARGPRIK